MKKIYLFGAFLFVSSILFAQEKPIKKELQSSTLSSKKAVVNEEQKREMSYNIKKENYIKLSDNAFRQENNIPNDFPKYTDTGELYKDIETHDYKIKTWIRSNSEIYTEIKEVINF